MTEITEAVEAIVEDTELPLRLREDVYETLEDREDLTLEQVEEIARAVESKYLDNRVPPLDPVGTVSAQSIGEPGTQMSVPYDERVLVRRGGETEMREIGRLVDETLDVRETRTLDDHEVARAPNDLEVPSLREDEGVEWMQVEEVSRHDAPDELLSFTLKSGREITATRAHSFVTRRNNEVVPVAGEELDVGDWLPIVSDLTVDDAPDHVDLRDHLPTGDYWFTSTLTDGGTASFPASDAQVANKRVALDRGEIDGDTAYPVGGTVGLPEQFPLDEGTGFFIGAWLAEGSLADGYVSISNVDPVFQERVRAFADRFDLSVNEYENESGFAMGYDIRINGTVLADFLSETCLVGDDKVVPGFAFGAPEGFVRGLLAGYVGGDGNAGRNAIRTSSTSERLTEGIALLFARIGVYGTIGDQKGSRTLRIPRKFVPRVDNRLDIPGERGVAIADLASSIDGGGPDTTDQVPNFGDALSEAASRAGIPARQVNSATNRQRIGRSRLSRLVEEIDSVTDERSPEIDALERAVDSDVVWDRIESIEVVEPDHEFVYDLSVAGLETFTTGRGIVTHNTMNTFHYAGVAEIDVTQGLPRLIELVDARKTPDTPMMTVHLEEEYANDREKAHEVVWQIEATKILALGDISTNVADMIVTVDLNEDTLQERWPTLHDTNQIAEEIATAMEDALGVSVTQQGTVLEFGPEQPSYRELLQLVEELRDVVFKGIEDISRVVIRKEQTDDGEEFVLYTEGSAFKKTLQIEGVDASRSTCNNIHEIHETLGIEAARETIIEETKDTLEEQGLGDVNVRHLMLVADIMSNDGTIQSIGRHGISGNKESVLARAAFEVTVNHLLDAAIYGEADDLDGVIENVIVGKAVKLGTGDVDLRMSASKSD
ncbi:DNA-directed RNA polymerase subunit A'' [Halanaeroarchaeum sulfurireducens]|uniref:DNA-directed RNA polymerase subunit Rpo1C n=1 Tax=Halanaeroarchaeum sulfurireducens TaxID=1604004 RepID=A0A0F7P8D3_9EURY|nr:DNA-directed RNA polymerase subunit A'' [Halanaeroarchaeum sulfurireducens]AKH97002.1 DNA-directed RNA polymerase subunit A' [Halanaeroarchaeum sulfurireducens]ALG81403.1 DNA-directed RNA polymerase subunit A' [Halanaeroarchaeum sulfurireducens]